MIFHLRINWSSYSPWEWYWLNLVDKSWWDFEPLDWYIHISLIILSCEIFFHGFVSLELALILFEIILTHICMNMIKALFVISYISQIAYLVINFSLCWTPLSFIGFFLLLWTHVISFKPKKQCFYPSCRASGALFIIMICMGVQEISVGVSGFVVWLWLVKWNMFSFSICEFHCWCNFGEEKKKEKNFKKKKKKKKEKKIGSDGRNCY